MKDLALFSRCSTLLLVVLLLLTGSAVSRVQAAPAPQVIELAHTPVSKAQGSHTVIPKKGGGYDFLAYAPTKVGDAITFTITVKESGNYRLQTTTYKDSAEGIYRLEINGVKMGEKDFYLSNVWEVGRYDVRAGTYAVTFRCIGQNPASKGIGLKLGTLHFR